MDAASTYDAVIVGAGPAGSAAAWALARAGRRVALVDRDVFPRDKVCGDALIPDALGAIDAMGLRRDVDARAARVSELRVYAPSGRFVSLAGAFSCLPRAQFDHLLVNAAVRAGAELIDGHDAVAPVTSGTRVQGARVRAAAGERDVRARWTLLATGANATALAAFGLGAPQKPNAVAGRAYFELPPRLAERLNHLSIVYERSLCPGYGWVFPGPERRFNVGVGYFRADRTARSLRELWSRFVVAFEPAADILREGVPLTEFRGAPLRTGLSAARFGAPGLLVLGEAAAMTYPATGEGIGKAMESGLLAADLVAAAGSTVTGGDRLHEAYEAEFRRRFEPRYDAYRTAEQWSSRPWLLNVLAWRANTGRFVRNELESLLSERGDPRRLFSSLGFLTSIFR